MIFINNIDPEIFTIGPIAIRWYGVFFALGLVLNYFIVRWAFKKNRKSLNIFESLVIYLFLGMVIGARFGHILFYNLGYYLENPVNIFKIWEGGLSSHGATIGLFIAYLIFIKIKKVKFGQFANEIMIGIPLTAGFVRIGNFFNSEIFGVPTNGKWGVVFQQLGENYPRHPVQIYESGLNFILFIAMFFIFKKFFKKLPRFFLLFFYLFFYFGGRFIIEFYKDLHTLPESFPLSMGQVLSILPILLAIIYFINLKFRSKKI